MPLTSNCVGRHVPYDVISPSMRSDVTRVVRPAVSVKTCGCGGHTVTRHDQAEFRYPQMSQGSVHSLWMCVYVTCYCYLMCICCTVCVLLFFFFTLGAGLLARSQYSEGPAPGHLDTGFSWFPCVYRQMLRWFPRFQVATTCFSCSPPDLNLLVTNFIFCIHVK